MTRLTEFFADRPPLQRVAVATLLAIGGLFLAGLTMGVVVAAIEQGHWPRKAWVLPLAVVSLPLGLAALYTAWRLLAPPADSSAYEQRYWRTILIVFALGVPVGIVAALSVGPGNVEAMNPFTSAPIAPFAAILLAALITVVGFIAATLYHRAIDDHEERAYLWGSQVAYYFVIIAFPIWWILHRGGLVPPIDTAITFIAIGASFVIQAIVWAWLKYR